MFRVFGFLYACLGICFYANASSCPNNYELVTGVPGATFMAPINNTCTESNYHIATIPDALVPLFTGFTYGGTTTLCGDGHISNNSCTSYTQDDCPQDYLNVTLSDSTFTANTMGSCASGYSKYTINQQCDSNTTDYMCAVLCSDGEQYTDVGTCATLCAPGFTQLNAKKSANEILSFPLYSTQQTTPSIVLGNGNEMCYVNLMPGNSANAINIKTNNTIYHTVR